MRTYDYLKDSSDWVSANHDYYPGDMPAFRHIKAPVIFYGTEYGLDRLASTISDIEIGVDFITVEGEKGAIKKLKRIVKDNLLQEKLLDVYNKMTISQKKQAIERLKEL